MKVLSAFGLFIISFAVNAQSELPYWAQERLKKLDGRYVPIDYLKPMVLEADFSGDSNSDLAILIEEKFDKKKGILILFAKTEKFFIVGSGNNLGPAGDNFDWAGEWGLFIGASTQETTFKKDGDIDGSREVALERPAIRIRQEEGSGGLIYFNGQKFVWIHQGD